MKVTKAKVINLLLIPYEEEVQILDKRKEKQSHTLQPSTKAKISLLHLLPSSLF